MSSNEEQAAYWNGRMGQDWVRVEDRIDSMMTPLSDVAINRMAAKRGEKILDVGCGCGTTTLQMAASGASLHGVDISEHMISQAKAKATNGADVSFSLTDAATESYSPDFDGVFSRFGVMFFDDPVAAFSNIRSALKDTGRMTFLCWREPAINPWMAVPGAAVQPFMPPDAPVPAPDDPGPFRFADAGYTKSMLEEAGFHNVAIESLEREISLGGGLDEAMEFQQFIGPLSRLLPELDEEKSIEATAAVRKAFEPFVTDKGIVSSAASWLVTATAS